MRGALSRGAVDVLEFEYGYAGHWNPKQRDKGEIRHLNATIASLHELGYACFVQGNGGCLVPVSGECFKPLYGSSYAWSNFVCATGRARTELWRLARQMVPGGTAACAPRSKPNGNDDAVLAERLRRASTGGAPARRM